MKKMILMILAITSMACQSNPTEPVQSVNCLEREWNDIGIDRITSERKSFDVANDADVYGGSFSCITYTTPYDLNLFINNLKTAIESNDLVKLEPLIYFPFVLIHERKVKGKKAKTTVINDMEGLSPLYDKVFYPEMKKLIECLSLDKFATSPNSGIDAAYGGLIINRYAESRKLYLTSISMDNPPVQKWLHKFCGS